MLKIKLCVFCSKPIVTRRRSDAKTCSNSCRTRLCSFSKANAVSIKLTISKLEFRKLKLEADGLGILVNQLMISRSLNNSGAVL